MYKLTTINIEKIECPILVRKVAGTHSPNGTDITDTPNGTQECYFTNGAELVASSFEEKYDIKAVRICSGSSGSSGGCDASIGCDSYYLEILVSKPECEQPISRNKDDSFF